MNNKKIVALICSVLLLVGAAGATLAWLTDQEGPVTNTFTVGNINIDLYEHKNDGDTEKVMNKTYKMVPGDTLFKDPKVEVKGGSEDCWLFVKVTENIANDVTVKENGQDVKKGFADYITYSVITGENEWTALDGNPGVYYREVAASTGDQVFNVIQDKDGNANKVTVKDTVTKAMMDALNGKQVPTLTFQAFAVQKAHVNTATEAWAKVAP